MLFHPEGGIESQTTSLTCVGNNKGNIMAFICKDAVWPLTKGSTRPTKQSIHTMISYNSFHIFNLNNQ